MESCIEVQVPADQSEILRSLLQVGVNLSAGTDRRETLHLILHEVRNLALAEAGCLYIVRGSKLQFAAAQNDRMSVTDVVDKFIGREMPISAGSLAGFVAMTGRTLNIPDAYRLTESAPFRFNRDFDLASGYRSQSILALPLTRPGGQCVGVMQLVNRIGRSGRIVPFPDLECSGIKSLAQMAAVTIHNMLLQDQLKDANIETIMRLSVAAEYRDDDTAEHIRRISNTSALVAGAMGLSEEEVDRIKYASPMHDIGKIGVPDAILGKCGKLTPQEREIMKQHTICGAKILANPQSELMITAQQVARWHHERWDGKGYPDGLRGEDIPLAARIVGLVDVFDALVTKRCYKDAFPLDVAMKIIATEQGKQFDPKVCAAFYRVLDGILAEYGL